MKSRTGCFAIVFLIGLLWAGGQGVFTAVTNWKLREYSVRNYIDTKPSAKWLRLTDGMLDMTQVDFTRTLGVGKVSKIYVPLRADGEDPEAPLHILLATHDPALLALAEKMRNVKTPEEAMLFFMQHREEMLIRKPVQGLVRFGIEQKEDEIRKLKTLNKDLAEDFIVIAEDEKPEFTIHALLLAGGLLLGFFLVKRMLATTPSGPKPPPMPAAGV